MRRLLTLLLPCLALAGSAHAVGLSYFGELTLQIATLPPIVLSGSGAATVNGSGPAGHLTALSLLSSPFAVTGTIVPVTDPGAFPIAGLKATAHNGSGVFAGTGGAGFGGVMPILGVAKVCLYGPCSATNNISNLSVPLSVIGQGGVGTVMGAVNLSVIGAPWTTQTAAVGVITIMGGVSPGSSTGATSGVVTLVTPVLILSSIGAFSVVPVFGILTLHFVPEPGTLALLGSGISALLLAARRRARSRRSA